MSVGKPRIDRNVVNANNVRTLVDRFAYSATNATVAGQSFSVDPAHFDAADNDASGSYCFATDVYNERAGAADAAPTRDYGTPGAANPPCP